MTLDPRRLCPTGAGRPLDSAVAMIRAEFAIDLRLMPANVQALAWPHVGNARPFSAE